MEPTDVTVLILQDIRGELRAGREQQAAFQREVAQRFEIVDKRFEVVETVLRDLAEQMVMLSRGIKVLIDDRPRWVEQIDDHEKRLRVLEQSRHN